MVPQLVSLVERSSLSQRVPYQRFHYTPTFILRHCCPKSCFSLQHYSLKLYVFISPEYLNSSIREFNSSAERLWLELKEASGDPSDLSLVRRLNDALMQLERAFIVPEGLPGRPYYK